MEYLVAAIAFAGALLAAIASVALIRRLQEEREGWLIAWTVAAIALCVSLAVVGVGSLIGFGTATFRFYQLTGSLLAPVWLAIGLIQLLATKTPAKFATWLIGIAFTVVASVVLIFDPVGETPPFSKALPPAAGHWDWPPAYLLLGAHVAVVVIMLAAMAVAGLRWRTGDETDVDNLHASLVIAPSGIALVGAVSFAVAEVFTVALLLVAAAAIWYSVLRPLAPYEDEEEEAGGVGVKDERWERGSGGRRAAPEPPVERAEPRAPVEPRRSRNSGLGDLVAEYRAGDQEVDYAARMAPDPFSAGPATGYIMTNGADPLARGPQTGPHGLPGAAPQTGSHGMPGTGPQSGSHGMPSSGPQTGERTVAHNLPGATPQTGAHAVPQGYGQPREPDYSMPGTGAVYPGAELPGYAATRPAAAVHQSRPSPNIFGLLTVFTIIDGSGDAFDRLAEETVQAVRGGEPDTLIYACHSVKSAPLQRIVYELYRDEVAYGDHQRQPHVQRFLTERQSMVLATNVIELNVNAAKVVPLPTAMF
ncbi:antibiotic biosynthesis monooxygenase [Nonomuraea sp. NPDC046570]|uniref:antibiotic biosynthesis monooxygenase n=1 Tax=Nonomuraea sp. NPDC046570 TaxID=3155255 RepID=UPI0033E89C08